MGQLEAECDSSGQLTPGPRISVCVLCIAPVLEKKNKKTKNLPLAMELKPGDDLNQNWASLVVQTVKNLPAMHEIWVQSLGWNNPLEKGMATHSSILAWRIPWTEEPGGLQSMGSQTVGHN